MAKRNEFGDKAYYKSMLERCDNLIDRKGAKRVGKIIVGDECEMKIGEIAALNAGRRGHIKEEKEVNKVVKRGIAAKVYK